MSSPEELFNKLSIAKTEKEAKVQMPIPKDLLSKVKSKFGSVSNFEKTIEQVHAYWQEQQKKPKSKKG